MFNDAIDKGINGTMYKQHFDDQSGGLSVQRTDGDK